MKHTVTRLTMFFLVVAFSWSGSAELRVGASSTSINPANGTLLGGYSQNRASTGVHDDLFAKDDKAFVADPTEELKLIEAMKRGSSMKVDATSDSGSSTSDTYSLMGISAALRGLSDTCP